jgi:hypothetical protein
VIPGRTRYEGTFRNNLRHGHGVYADDTNRYEGEYVDDQRHGYGVVDYLKTGNRYEGYFQNGNRTGHGVYIFANGNRLEAEFENGKTVGRGRKTYAKGGFYDGDLDGDGRPHGIGTWELEDGSRYEGECVQGWREGRGVLIKPDGTRLEGLFVKDEYVGQEAPDNTQKE